MRVTIDLAMCDWSERTVAARGKQIDLALRGQACATLALLSASDGRE